MNKVYPLDVSSGYPGAPAPSVHQSSQESADNAPSLQGIVRAVRRRLSLMMAVFLLTFAAIAVLTFQLTPVYSATASVIVNTRDSRVIDIGAVISGMPADTAFLDTEVEILRSRALATKVVRRLDLMEDPDFNITLREPTSTDRRLSQISSFFGGLTSFGRNDAAEEVGEEPADPAAAAKSEFEDVVTAVAEAFDINRVGSTYLIEITASNGDPEKASLLANTLSQVYLDNQLDTKYDATRRAQEWLDERVTQLREEVRIAESRVEAHRARTGLLSAEGSTLTEQAIRDTNAQLLAARSELAENRARLQNVNNQITAGGGVDTIVEALNSPAINDLRRQQTQLVQRKAALLTRYGDRHPEVQRVINEESDLERQINAELRRIVSSLEQDVLISREAVNSLQAQLNTYKSELTGNNQDAVELAELQRDADASRTLYEEFLNRFKETTQLDGITESDAVINSEAAVPRIPSFPNIPLNLALGLMLGLALAGMTGLVTELMDNYISSPEEAEQASGVPYIGQIPLMPSSAKKMNPAEYLVEKPHTGFAEAFRNLRASIMFADIDKAAKTVAVVSSLPDEGKTSLTYCLGRMAAMSGTKTIIIDGDLRRRQLTEVSGMDPEAGLLEYLFGEARLSDAVVTDEKTGLDILPLTDRKHTPRDVFGSRAFDALMNMLQQTYDLIVIDTGPVLLMAETRVVTSKVDQVVVACRWRKTPRGTVKDTMKVLRDFRANIAGVVLTFVDLRKRAHSAYNSSNYRAYAKYYSAD